MAGIRRALWRNAAVAALVIWNREIFYKTYQSLPLTVPKIVFLKILLIFY